MPALEKVGVQLEARDWQKFVKALNFAGRAVTHLNKTLSAFATTMVVEGQKVGKSTKAYTESLAKLAKQSAALFQVQERIAEQEIQDLLEVAKLRDLAIKQQVDAANRRMEVMHGEYQFSQRMSAQRATQRKAEIALAEEQAYKEKALRETTASYTEALIALAKQASLLPGILGKVAAALALVGSKTKAAAAAAAAAPGLFGKIATGLSAAVAAIGTAISALSGGTLIAIGIAAAAFVGFIVTVKLVGSVLGKLVSVFGTVAKGITTLFTKVLSTAVSLLVSGIRTAIDAISSLVSTAFSALGKVAAKLAEIGEKFARAAFSFIEGALTMAGRFNEMELAAVATGRGIGLTDDAILKAIKSVNAMNIRYDVAAASIMRMARVQIDLKYATDLVRIAQAMAVETGRDSSEEMTSLTHALTTNNVQMLRRHGIIIDNDKAERDYAKTNDLVVGSLTARQKIEAQIQAVIRESTHLMGVYEAALRSGSKIMRSIENRLIPEFVAALGAPLQGAFYEVTRAVFDFLTVLNESLRFGGRFAPLLTKIGAVAQIAGEGIKQLVSKLTDFVRGAETVEWVMRRVIGGFERIEVAIDPVADRIDDWFSKLAVNAFEWGANIMLQFAEGIMFGINYIANAMVQVAGALASWLAAFSPPKVAPDIAKWGAAVMAEYLRGFAMVDFGAFEGIQKVLGRLLGGPQLAGLLGEVIEAMATGTVGEDLFGRIAAATGAYGAEIVKLTKLQFKYADALRAVEAAQLALTRAQEAVKGHSVEVDKLVREYNRLLRAGAGDEMLDTRLAEINASERARNVAIVERDEAQVAIRLAEERLTPIKEALALQEKLVDVLLDLASAQADVVAKTKKAAKGGAEAILEEFGGLGARIGDVFATSMQKAIDRIKDTIKERLAGIFQPVWEAFFGKPILGPPFTLGLEGKYDQPTEIGRMGGIVQEFQKIADAWGPLWEEIRGVWEAISAPGGITAALLAFPEPIGDLAKAIAAVKWAELATAIGNLVGVIGGMLGIEMPEGGAFAGITRTLEDLFLGREVTEALPREHFVGGIPTGEQMTVRLLAPFELLTIAINDKLIPAINDFTEKIEGVTETLKTVREIVDRIGNVMTALGLRKEAERPLGTYLGPLGAAYEAIKAGRGAPSAPAGAALLGGGGAEGGIGEVATDIVSSIINSIKGAFDRADWSGILGRILTGFRTILQIASPAHVMEPIGTSITEGIALGMPGGMPFIFTSMQLIANEMLTAAAPDATTPLANTLIAVGAAFTGLIGKGIKENVGKIIGAMDEAVRRARQHIAQLGDEAARRSGWPGTPPPDDSQQQGGYSPRGGVHHPGEYVIPAGLTRALMQPVSRTSNIQVGPNNISQAIDQAYLISLVRNTVRREIARAH